MKKSIFTAILSIFILGAGLVSCKSNQIISDDKTSAQIIQMGQNNFSAYHYKDAIRCYKTVLERFGSDPEIYAEATYEIGHIYIAQKKYAEAYDIFNGLISIYNQNPGVIPPAYKKLSEIGISQIPEKKLKEIQADSPAN